MADDYRLLFGSSLAISERNGHLNQQIVPQPVRPGQLVHVGLGGLRRLSAGAGGARPDRQSGEVAALSIRT
jgi:hypothetical protein